MAYGEAKKENGFESVPLVEEFVIETLKSIDTKGYTDCQGSIVARQAVADKYEFHKK